MHPSQNDFCTHCASCTLQHCLFSKDTTRRYNLDFASHNPRTPGCPRSSQTIQLTREQWKKSQGYKGPLWLCRQSIPLCCTHLEGQWKEGDLTPVHSEHQSHAHTCTNHNTFIQKHQLLHKIATFAIQVYCTCTLQSLPTSTLVVHLHHIHLNLHMHSRAISLQAPQYLSCRLKFLPLCIHRRSRAAGEPTARKQCYRS